MFSHQIIFLTGIRSATLGTKFNKSNPNISTEEEKALAKLIELQKTCQIIIKPCDKGAGIIVCDYVDYAESCSNHLNSKAENGEPHYRRISSVKQVIFFI